MSLTLLAIINAYALQSLIKKSDQESLNCETAITGPEASSEKTTDVDESLVELSESAIRNLSLEDQPASEEVSIGVLLILIIFSFIFFAERECWNTELEWNYWEW